jgi:hypothetical protein
MTWYHEFDSIFWISLGTLITGMIGLSAKYCLRSRCETCNFCFGLVQIHRRVDLEAQEHIRELELGVSGDEKDEEKTNI